MKKALALLLLCSAASAQDHSDLGRLMASCETHGNPPEEVLRCQRVLAGIYMQVLNLPAPPMPAPTYTPDTTCTAKQNMSGHWVMTCD